MHKRRREYEYASPVARKADSGASVGQRDAAFAHLQRTVGNAAVANLLAEGGCPKRTDEVDLPFDHEDSLGGGTVDTTQEEKDQVASPAPPEFEHTIPDGEERAEGDPVGRKVQRLFGFGSSPPTKFPSYARILASPTVQMAVHAAWLETLWTCTPTERREQGFWIQWNSKWGTFSVGQTGLGPVVGPGVGASVVLPGKPGDQGNVYTVGSFHTHTPTTYRQVGRPVGPSGADLAADASDNVAGVVYDFWGNGKGNLPAGRSRLWPARLYHSGNSRRT